LLFAVVHIALELDNDPFVETAEVHDEPVQNVLPAELQPENPSVAQERPHMTFGGSGFMA